MRNKLGKLCLVLGTALILAALLLFLRNQREEQNAVESVEVVLPLIVEQIVEERMEAQATEPAAPGYREMTVTEINGYGYVGFLSIPALGLELPVLAELDYARLKIAPCRYYGSVRSDDLVIAAHNFQSHFGKLSSLGVGESVIFTDMDGNIIHYEVAALDILEPKAVPEMTAGEYPLALFTCTYGGQNRVTVFCGRA